MDGLLGQIGTARVRVRRLLADRARLAEVVEAAEGRARDGSREIEVLKARIKELEQENGVLRKAAAAPQGPSRDGTKEQIDELVDEIDQCLALLSK